MPVIEWKALPRQVQDHLLDRLRVRGITAQDLGVLLAWINADPQVPEGAWCKDFGSLKVVGEGISQNVPKQRTALLWSEDLNPALGRRRNQHPPDAIDGKGREAGRP